MDHMSLWEPQDLMNKRSDILLVTVPYISSKVKGDVLRSGIIRKCWQLHKRDGGWARMIAWRGCGCESPESGPEVNCLDVTWRQGCCELWLQRWCCNQFLMSLEICWWGVAGVGSRMIMGQVKNWKGKRHVRLSNQKEKKEIKNTLYLWKS